MNSKQYLFFILILLDISCPPIFSQSNQTAGGYIQRYYSSRAYQMHPRNFYVAQDRREVLYIGNAYGVIEYDGTSWRDIPLTNGNSGLSLHCSTDSTVYVGSYNELGRLITDTAGSTKYQSLYSLIPADKNQIEKIHGIYTHQNSVVFHSSFGLYCYENNAFSVITPASADHLFLFVKKIGSDLLVQESDRGLMRLKGTVLEEIPGGASFRNNEIREILVLENSSMLVLESSGLYWFDSGVRKPLNENSNRLLASQQATHALRLNNGNLLVTTVNNGFYLLDAAGNVLKHIYQNNGLPANTINHAFLDKRGGLWLALDNGISFIEINSPFTYAGYSSGLPGMGYSSALFNGKLYLGSSMGLFVGNPTEGKYQEVPGVRGEIWNLSVINNSLLCCQTDNLFQIVGDRAVEIPCPYEGHGNWKIIPVSGKADLALKGTYEGFQLYRYAGGKWTFERRLAGFDESCRVFAQDSDGAIWMCHGNKGVYKIQIEEDYSKIKSAINYSTKNNFAPDFFNDVSLVDGQIILSSDHGFFTPVPSGEKIIPYSTLNSIAGEDHFISKLYQYSENKIWIFGGNDLILYNKQGADYQKEEVVFRKISGEMVGSYEYLMPLTGQVAVIGSQEGFIFYDQRQKTSVSTPFPVMIRKIEAPFEEDSMLYGGNGSDRAEKKWSYDFNSLRFSFSALYYENPEKIRYQYALTTGNEEVQWSALTSNSQVEFLSLYEGRYSFHVRAQNIYGEQSSECVYTFVIQAPWYRSLWAYGVYTILFIVATIVLAGIIRRRFQRQREKLEEENRNALLLQEQQYIAENLQKEKELMTLRNSKLESEVLLKNNELASLATTLTQKSEFLTHLRERLEGLQSNSTNKASDSTFKEIIKTIDQDLDFDDDWARFQLHFDELHHNFLHRLRNSYPKLKPSWLLLCAYIRMNKSNKEIASHLNISVAGVEKRKYRLREKLELPEDAKLAEFIGSF